MSRRRKLILTVVVLFIGINSFLVYADDEDRVPRVTYIQEWTQTFEQDMSETIETTGVLATAEEKNVYFDQKKGSFQEFLVEEGTEVEIGDDLFTYKADSYFETMTDLESKQQKLTGEIQAIESAIASISAYRIPETDMETNSANRMPETNMEADSANLPPEIDLENEADSVEGTMGMTSRSVDANYMKEQYLAEKEKELAQKEAELQSVQAQISELESNGETITVESPYQGKVTTVSDSLDNPVVTIWDNQLQAEGELTEAERMKVEQEMPVEVDIRGNDTVLNGTLSTVSASPESVDVHGSSLYPFEVSFEDEQPSQSEEAPQAEASDVQIKLPPSEETVENGQPDGSRDTKDTASSQETEDPGQPSESPDTEEAERPSSDTQAAEQGEADQSDMEDLLPGYHAGLTITTNESQGAAAVMKSQLFNKHLWKMTSEGLLVKRPVKTGIHMDNMIEITEGASSGEWIAESDNDQFHDGAVFMTPLKIEDIEWQDLRKYDNVNWKRYMIIGLLSR
ncbi:HlyD family efflux transporter periplasmic adaptor subunit [Lentibacillus jeotgali]|uniref:HlyD family efflux transporter periplasmic adaptor subunit n=1 Tax=Lentibacillus jeotgali TaxID=558169 RepID=UPI00026263E4|nr:HlyD family efflux transporter periplasmic adaptor subunit [Lentibacillus jeotgali]